MGLRMECLSQVTSPFEQRAGLPDMGKVRNSLQNPVGNTQAIGLLVDDALVLHFDAC